MSLGRIASLALLLLILGCTRVFAQPEFDAVDDHQAWGGAQLALPLRENLDLVLLGSLRQGRDFTHLVYENAGGSLVFGFGKHFTLSPMYQFIGAQPYSTVHTLENRISLVASFRFPLKKLVVSNVQQLEQRMRRPNNSNRYRNRLQLEWPIRLGESQFRLFAADEIFYDWTLGSWNRNRLYLGAGKSLSKSLSVDVFVMKQNSKLSLPRDVIAIGALFRIRLDHNPLHHLP